MTIAVMRAVDSMPWRTSGQVKQREPEGRGQERRLQVHRDDDAEPHEVDAQFVGNRREQRQQDERDFEEVQEAAQDEDQHVDHHQETERPAGKLVEQMFDPLGAIDSLESQAEDGRADQHEDHEAGQFGR